MTGIWRRTSLSYHGNLRGRKELIVQSKAKLRCERKDSLSLSILVRLRKRLRKNNVGVCQIVTRFSADCLDSYRKVGAKISGSVE